MPDDVYEANVRIRALPRSVDHDLNLIATMRQMAKWEIIRVALIEFAKNHQHEIVALKNRA